MEGQYISHLILIHIYQLICHLYKYIFYDYFYPYRVAGQEFPDEAAFRKYPRGFAPNQKEDWRRNNVNMVIEELQKTIKSVKPWVEFGISPFGVWRNDNVDPRGSATRAGVQNYDDLYADILKWLKEGSIDYVVPQLYWEIGKKVADYEVLAKWWSENSYGKNLYIGLYNSQLGSPDANIAWRKGNELARQLNMNLRYPQIDGAVYFSAKPFLKNKQGLNDTLQSNYYKYPALCPINRNIVGAVVGVQPFGGEGLFIAVLTGLLGQRCRLPRQKERRWRYCPQR